MRAQVPRGAVLTDMGTLREALVHLFYVPATSASRINDRLKELDNREIDFFLAYVL